MTNQSVKWAELVQVLEYQNMSLDDFHPGDILLIRFGYIAQYEEMDVSKRDKLNELYKTQKPENIGIRPSEEFLKFLWDKKIAAVGGDSRSFEVWPCQELEWHLHEWLLAGWGMTIGELFDLEALSRISASLGRYTFFLSSSPMNVRYIIPAYPLCDYTLTYDKAPGGVASPPNALAFF